MVRYRGGAALFSAVNMMIETLWEYSQTESGDAAKEPDDAFVRTKSCNADETAKTHLDSPDASSAKMVELPVNCHGATPSGEDTSFESKSGCVDGGMSEREIETPTHASHDLSDPRVAPQDDTSSETGHSMRAISHHGISRWGDSMDVKHGSTVDTGQALNRDSAATDEGANPSAMPVCGWQPGPRAPVLAKLDASVCDGNAAGPTGASDEFASPVHGPHQDAEGERCSGGQFGELSSSRVEAVSADLYRFAFEGWRTHQQHMSKKRFDSLAEAQMISARRDALSLWLLVPSAREPRLRANLCAWHETVAARQAFRARARSRQRAAFSPEEIPLESPAPVRKALGALFANNRDLRIRGSFFAWKDSTLDSKRRMATLMWLMERMALTQSGLIVQGTFWSWYHLTAPSRQPAWALALKQDLKLLKAPLSTSLAEEACTHVSPRANDAAPETVRRACGTPAMICVCTLILHSILLTSRSSVHAPRVSRDARLQATSDGPDTDGDGVRDAVDSCPETPARYKFQSSWRTDWDGDGCMDSAEDLDDDDDLVPNSQDVCPRTELALGDVDLEGCAHSQRREQTVSASFLKLGDVLLEVIVGTLFTAAFNYGCSFFGGPAALFRKLGREIRR